MAEDAFTRIANGIRACYGNPTNQDFLISKLQDYASEDRNFYTKLLRGVKEIHGGKLKVPLSEKEKENITSTFEIWKSNYPTAKKTREAMGEFFNLGEKRIEEIITEINKKKEPKPIQEK